MSDDTVTLPRAEYEALLKQKELVQSLRDELEDIADAAFMQQVERDVEAGTHKGEYLRSELVDRLLEGKEHRLRVWREHRGLTMLQLEAKSGIKLSYISVI
jgi:hypothetical protein